MEDATRKYVPKSVRLMDQVHEVLCFHHYAYKPKSPVSAGFCSIFAFTIKNIAGKSSPAEKRAIIHSS